ncbi:MAG: hypothetical protein U1C96_07230 [Gallionella sp.]|nr:hypothetical protein [Gallionella sp.]
MKRLLQCEEWSRLRVGRGLELETFDELTTILSAWKRNTGVDPSGYFDIRSDALMPKFWSGTLDTPKFTLEVSPIGSTALGDVMRARLDSSISAMLATATSSQSMSTGIASLSSDGGRYDALLGVFCDDLHLARRRQVLRRYVSVRESVPSPKGRIAFPSQCYESIRRPGRFSSEWVALTEDIPENKIFKEVLLRYRPRCSANIRGKIDFCLAELDPVVSTADYRLEWARVRTDRLPGIYLSLLKQSRSLLDGEGVGVFSGKTLATAEIVFTSRLFEQFVAKELAWISPSVGLRVKPQERGIFLCARGDGGHSFEIIPDIRLTDAVGTTKFILDTKWKCLNHDMKNLGISREDIYQVLVYAAKHECSDVILLYPDASPVTGEIGYYEKFITRLAGRDYGIHVAKLPLLAPNLLASRAYLKELLGVSLHQGMALRKEKIAV